MDLALVLYLADLFESLNAASVTVFGLGVLSVPITLAVTGAKDNSPYEEQPDISRTRQALNFFKSKVWIYATILIIAVILPSKKTIYLMAGVSVAEDVALSPEGEKARKLLNKYLDEQLSEDADETE